MSAVPVHEVSRDPFFRVRRFAHANLFVSSYERAYEFYNRVVGMEEAYRQPDNRASFVSNGNTYHDFGLTDVTSPYAKPGQQPGLNHFAFEVDNERELVDSYNQAVEQGVDFAACMDHDAAHALYQHDPEGNELEIYADVVEDWRSVKTGVIIKKKPKWIPGVTSEPSSVSMVPKDFEHRVVSDAVFHPLRVASFGLVVDDFGAMYDFYRDMIGVKPLFGNREGPVALLGGTLGHGDFALYRSRPGLPKGMHHVGLEVGDEADLRRSIDRLGEEGIEPVSVQDHPARLAVTIADPDGTLLQFYVDRDWSADRIASVGFDEALFLF